MPKNSGYFVGAAHLGFVFNNYSWKCLGDHIVFKELNLGHPHIELHTIVLVLGKVFVYCIPSSAGTLGAQRKCWINSEWEREYLLFIEHPGLAIIISF